MTFLLSSPSWHLQVPIAALRTLENEVNKGNFIFRRAKGNMKEDGGGGGGGVESLTWGHDQGRGSRRVWDIHQLTGRHRTKRYDRGTQRECSSKPLKHSIVKRALVFKQWIWAYFYAL